MDTPFRPTLRTQADLEAAWAHLIGTGGFRHRSVWMLAIEADDRPFPHVTEFAEVDDLPTTSFLDAFTEVLDRLFADLPARRLAFLVSRPGVDGVRPSDRAWAATLYEVGRRVRLPCEVVHLATDATVLPLPLDELRLDAS